MEEEVPQQLKTAAIVQLVSGIVNIIVMSFITYMAVGTVMGICTIFLGGIGFVCGFWGCLLIPIGIFEVVAGVMGLTNPRGAAEIMRYATFAEMAGILFGGVPGAVAGFLVQKWLQEPDVLAYLEADTAVP